MHSVKSTYTRNRREECAAQYALSSDRALTLLDSTTSFLTATTLVYAIGAGITAAAGTRLALQLFLVKGFKVYSFRLPGLG